MLAGRWRERASGASETRTNRGDFVQDASPTPFLFPAFVRRRVWTTLLAVAVVAAGLSARALLDGALANFLGVALWSVLVYVGILWVRPDTRPLPAALLCTAIGLAVEIAQLTPGPAALGEIHRGFHLVFGSRFDVRDLPAYPAGAAIAALAHAFVRAGRGSRSPLAS